MIVRKDYYKILNVKSSAQAGEIKNAYRKLAMKYHPDRNPDDALASAVFADVAEAYKVLSDAEARKQYNYERYLTAEQEYTGPAETLETLIKRIQKINEQVKASDPFRFNKDALLYSVKQLFPENINLLVHAEDNLLNRFLKLISLVAVHLSSRHTKQLIILLHPFYKKNAWLQQKLTALQYKQQKDERWEKGKIFIALVAAIILCAVIFLAASK